MVESHRSPHPSSLLCLLRLPLVYATDALGVWHAHTGPLGTNKHIPLVG